MAAKKSNKKKKVSKKKKSFPSSGRVYVKATFNNTILTLTDENGDVLLWQSSGQKFKGTRKSTPYAAQVTASELAEKAKDGGIKEVDIYVQGIGIGRESAVRALYAAGLGIKTISDVTPIPHNGCRPKKPRRV